MQAFYSYAMLEQRRRHFQRDSLIQRTRVKLVRGIYKQVRMNLGDSHLRWNQSMAAVGSAEGKRVKFSRLGKHEVKECHPKSRGHCTRKVQAQRHCCQLPIIEIGKRHRRFKFPGVFHCAKEITTGRIEEAKIRKIPSLSKEFSIVGLTCGDPQEDSAVKVQGRHPASKVRKTKMLLPTYDLPSLRRVADCDGEGSGQAILQRKFKILIGKETEL